MRLSSGACVSVVPTLLLSATWTGRRGPRCSRTHCRACHCGLFSLKMAKSTSSSSSSIEHAGFTINEPRYDQATAWGRFRHFMDIADPRCLTPRVFFGMSIDESVALMEQYREGTLPPGISAEKLWTAKKIKSSAIHQDTGEKVVPPFRMCGFAVFGTPIVVGMMLPNASMASTVFFQTLNQSHNAGVNFANKPASGSITTASILQGYGAAVASSVFFALGIKETIARSSLATSTKLALSRFVPYPAVATASACNMFFMRRSELDSGIDVKDASGNVLGKSKVAAGEAIKQTMVTRVVLPAPLLLIPPTVMLGLEKTPLLFKFPKLRLPIEATVCTLAFVFGLPFALSLFPQDARIAAASLEPEFHNKHDVSGRPITEYIYNKGL